jgi:predicted nuclease of restriction endonuclease-like (RecB) superfamily
VTDADARRFYEAEAVRAERSRRDSERPINSLYQQRLLAGTDRADMLQNQHQPLGGM